MLRKHAMATAGDIARQLLSAAERYQQSAYLFKSLRHVDTTINEILLFGSTARREDHEEVGDIDLMVFGSHWLARQVRPAHYRLGLSRRRQLANFMAKLDDYSFGSQPPTDLQVIPATFFVDGHIADAYQSIQRDPRFFENVFRDAMRFDRDENKFVKTNYGDLEHRITQQLNNATAAA